MEGCKHCGHAGTVQRMKYWGGLIEVRCLDCGYTTGFYRHIRLAVNEWNKRLENESNIDRTSV